MDPNRPGDIQKPEVTELICYSATATDGRKLVQYENLNQHILRWLMS